MRVPVTPPSVASLLARSEDTGRMHRVLEAGALRPTVDGKYLHWDKVLHLDPPEGLSREDWWVAIKMARLPLHRTVPLLDRKGEPFRFALADPVLELGSGIDRDASGRIEVSEQVTSPELRDRYLVTSLIEEAASSSILEGAATTVQRAKEMIRSGREPRDRGERMVLNNYIAMRRIQELVERELTVDLVLDLHRTVTEDTLGDPGAGGRLRRPGDREDAIVVTDRSDGTTLHVPPDAAELPDRVRRMCDFANSESGDPYVPPVVRAIILHFWLAYDHPFVDGNGRTARALFYWSMLRQGYWLISFVSISRLLTRAPARYARSFLYTETDDNDLTYFILYQLEVLRRAIDELHEFLARKTREIRAVERVLKPSVGLNHRQLALLGHALRHPDARYTIGSHQRSHDVVYQTARTDLHDLSDRALLDRRKIGRRYVYSPPSDLVERLQRLEA